VPITHEAEQALERVDEARKNLIAALQARDEAIFDAVKPAERGGGGANLRAVAEVAGVSHETVRKIYRDMGTTAAAGLPSAASA
jgi:hypothetical protein